MSYGILKALFLTNLCPLSSADPLKQHQFLHHIPYIFLHHLVSSAPFQVPVSLKLSVVIHLITTVTSALFHSPISSIPTSPGTFHDLFPWEVWLKSKIKAKHFNWIKIVFLQFLQMQQSGFCWKLSTPQKSLQGQALPRSSSVPLQQGQSILCHVQTSGCSVRLPPSSPKSMLPSPEGVPAFSLVHVPQSAV